MKHFLFLLAFCIPALSQPVTVVLPQPDCQIVINLTTVNQTTPTAPNAGFNNITGGCSTWAMTIAVSGFSSATVALQSAPNVAGVPGTWVTYNGTPFSPSPHNNNPITSSAEDFVWIYGYNPWVRVQLTAATGTGVVNGLAYGWRLPSASSNGAGSGGASNVNIADFGGVAVALGQALMAASMPVTIASNQSAIGTFITGNASLLTGQQAVTASAVALPTNAAKTVCIWGLYTNTIPIYFGASGVSTSTGVPLLAGQPTCQPLNNSNLVYVIATTTGASVAWALTN
jgi:hypothetical protein